MTAFTEWVKRALLEAQEYTLLAMATARCAVTRPFYWHDFVEQLNAIGYGSMTVVILTGLFTGAVLALQSGFTLDQFGARPFVGRLVSASMIKELGPVLTALMLAGRVSSGIAAELGSMVVTEQVNALRALGTDPVRKLVVPRVLAGILMTPVLTVVANTVGLLGGWVVSVKTLRVSSGLYWSSVVDGLFMEDVWMGVLKPFFLGFIIVTVGCHVGLRTRGGTQGVGRATTNAVVAASVGVIAMDFFCHPAPAGAAVLMVAIPEELRGPARGKPGDDPVVEFDDVRLAFDDNVVLDGISFKLFAGFTKIFLGASGSGKSTVLKLILGLLAPDSGRIWVHGQQIDRMSENDLFAVRDHTGMVFQEGALFDSLTVGENVGFKLYEETDQPLDEIRARVEEVLGFVELGPYRGPQAVGALGRAASPRRDRPSHGVQAEAAALRRADHRPRPADVADRRRRDHQAARSRRGHLSGRHAPAARRLPHRHPRRHPRPRRPRHRQRVARQGRGG